MSNDKNLSERAMEIQEAAYRQEPSQEVLDLISAEAMQEYEDVRRGGLCNMFDTNCVMTVADAMGFDALFEIAAERAPYVALLSNFGKLMRHYGISQEVKAL